MVLAVSEWHEFGLIGLVVGALFALVGYLIRVGMQHSQEATATHNETLDRIDERHVEQMREIKDEHRQERTAWHSQLESVADKIADAIRNPTRQ